MTTEAQTPSYALFQNYKPRVATRLRPTVWIPGTLWTWMPLCTRALCWGQALGQWETVRPTRPGEAGVVGRHSPGASCPSALAGPPRSAPSMGRVGPPGELRGGSEACQSHTDLPVPELSQPAGAQPQETTRCPTTCSCRHGPRHILGAQVRET